MWIFALNVFLENICIYFSSLLLTDWKCFKQTKNFSSVMFCWLHSYRLMHLSPIIYRPNNCAEGWNYLTLLTHMLENMPQFVAESPLISSALHNWVRGIQCVVTQLSHSFSQLFYFIITHTNTHLESNGVAVTPHHLTQAVCVHVCVCAF